MITFPEALSPIAGIAEEFRLISDSRIYFLVRETKVVYVGRTTDIRQRILAHRVQKEFDRVFSIQVPFEEAAFLEAALIEVLKPSLNAPMPAYLVTNYGRYLATKLGFGSTVSVIAANLPQACDRGENA